MGDKLLLLFIHWFDKPDSCWLILTLKLMLPAPVLCEFEASHFGREKAKRERESSSLSQLFIFLRNDETEAKFKVKVEADAEAKATASVIPMTGKQRIYKSSTHMH